MKHIATPLLGALTLAVGATGAPSSLLPSSSSSSSSFDLSTSAGMGYLNRTTPTYTGTLSTGYLTGTINLNTVLFDIHQNNSMVSFPIQTTVAYPCSTVPTHVTATICTLTATSMTNVEHSIRVAIAITETITLPTGSGFIPTGSDGMVSPSGTVSRLATRPRLVLE